MTKSANGIAPHCPFCAHDKPIVVTMPSDPPVYIVACPECGASGPKSQPGIEPRDAVNLCNSRYGPN